MYITANSCGKRTTNTRSEHRYHSVYIESTVIPITVARIPTPNMDTLMTHKISFSEACYKRKKRKLRKKEMGDLIVEEIVILLMYWKLYRAPDNKIKQLRNSKYQALDIKSYVTVVFEITLTSPQQMPASWGRFILKHTGNSKIAKSFGP